MNKKRLKKFVKALHTLPWTLQEFGVRLTSPLSPGIAIKGCHAGMFSILADRFPPLKKIYCRELKLAGETGYCFLTWQKAVEVYLQVETTLPAWAAANPNFWGNGFGDCMFKSQIAFTDSEGNPPVMNYESLIDWWQEVCDRVCKA